MSNQPHPHDLGVILFLADDPTTAPTIKDRSGNALVAQDLDNSVWQYADVGVCSGALELVALTVVGLIGVGGSVKMRVLSRRREDQNSDQQAWAEVAATRAEDGTVATEHTIAAAELLAEVGAGKRAMKFIVQHHQGDASLRVALKLQQASAANDYLVVSGHRILPTNRS